MQPKFDVAVITGASSGIGREMALMGAVLCNTLVLVARRQDLLDALCLEIEAKGCHAIAVALDLSSSGSAEAVLQAAQAVGGRVDVLINNAGFGLHGDYLALDGARERAMVELNILALMDLCKIFGNLMVQQGRGRILNVASVAAFQPGPTMAVYFASKAFVLSFSEAIDRELSSRGVRVLTLCPGSTITPFHEIAGVQRERFVHGLAKMKPHPVAREGWLAILHDRVVVVPGLLNRILVNSTRFMPRSWVAALAHKIIR